MNYSKQFLKKLGEAISDVIEDDKINEPTKYVADKISKWIVNEEKLEQWRQNMVNELDVLRLNNNLNNQKIQELLSFKNRYEEINGFFEIIKNKIDLIDGVFLELKGIIIASKFEDDKPKTSIDFSEGMLTKDDKRIQNEFTNRDEIMKRLYFFKDFIDLTKRMVK